MEISVVDQRRYARLTAALRDEHDDVPLQHRELREIAAFYRADLYSIYLVMSLHPFSAVVLLNNKQAAFDKLLFGEHAAELSPYSVPGAVFAPSWVLYGYISQFQDTNPRQVAGLSVLLSLHAVLHTAVLLTSLAQLFVRSQRQQAAANLGFWLVVTPMLCLSAATVFRYALWPLLPRMVWDRLFLPLMALGPANPLLLALIARGIEATWPGKLSSFRLLRLCGIRGNDAVALKAAAATADAPAELHRRERRLSEGDRRHDAAANRERERGHQAAGRRDHHRHHHQSHHRRHDSDDEDSLHQRRPRDSSGHCDGGPRRRHHHHDDEEQLQRHGDRRHRHHHHDGSDHDAASADDADASGHGSGCGSHSHSGNSGRDDAVSGQTGHHDDDHAAGPRGRRRAQDRDADADVDAHTDSGISGRHRVPDRPGHSTFLAVA